jgi:hypothetical protein
MNIRIVFSAHRRNGMRSKDMFGLSKSLAISLVLALGLFLPSLVSAQASTVVSVSAPSQSITPGEQFTVDIVVEPGTAIAGVQLDLSFDPSLVTVDTVAEGNLLAQNGASTYFMPGTINNVSGTVSGIAGAIITPGQAVSTAGTFAIITLTAGEGGGTSSLTMSNVVVGDIDGNSVAVSVVNGQVAVNQPPILGPVGNRTVNEGEILEFTISANDSDNDTLTYSASELPSGASFDPESRTFSWTPRFDQAGTYPNVHFEVSDGSLVDSEDIAITVNQPYADWDVNGDATVNVLDMIRVGQHWDEVGLSGWIPEDVNEDGAISVLDMILIGQHWAV